MPHLWHINYFPMYLSLHFHFAFVFAFWNRKNHASKRHSRDKCRIYGIKTIFLCICLCICLCILPLYLRKNHFSMHFWNPLPLKFPLPLPSKRHCLCLWDKYRLPKEINAAFRAYKLFSYAVAFAFAFCLCLCLLKSTNHSAKRHSRDKCRI